jgi:hypothetical protein
MQISKSVQAGHQFQALQTGRNQTTNVEGSKAEESNESTAQKTAETQKNAISQSTGVGLNIDKSI